MKKILVTVVIFAICATLAVASFFVFAYHADIKPTRIPPEPDYNPNDSSYYGTFDRRSTVDFSNALTDNFDGSIADFWRIVDGAWHHNENYGEGTKGNDYHNGCLKENVQLMDSYDGKDGVLALRATADSYSYHDDELTNRFKYNFSEKITEKSDNIDSTRSGACLVTPEIYGPGRYETVMKPLPFDGTVSALWTFQWAGNGTEQNEIDIEIVSGGTEGSYAVIWYTSWTASNSTVSEHVKLADVDLDYFLNDGQWHKFTFDWYTDFNFSGDKRIDWFIDEKCIYSLTGENMDIQNKISDHPGSIWLGCWLSGWSSKYTYRNWDTAYMLVDSFTYIPFTNLDGLKETSYRPTDYKLYKAVTSASSDEDDYLVKKVDSATVDSFMTQWLVNGDFENVYQGGVYIMDRENVGTGNQGYVGWVKGKIKRTYIGDINVELVDDANTGSHALKVEANTVAENTNVKVYDNYKFDFEMYAKLGSAESVGWIKILFRIDDDGYAQIDTTKTITLNITSTDYTKISQEIVAPVGTREMIIRVGCESGSVIVDSGSMLYKGTAK